MSAATANGFLQHCSIVARTTHWRVVYYGSTAVHSSYWEAVMMVGLEFRRRLTAESPRPAAAGRGTLAVST